MDDEQERYFESWLYERYGRRPSELKAGSLYALRKIFEAELKENN